MGKRIQREDLEAMANHIRRMLRTSKVINSPIPQWITRWKINYAKSALFTAEFMLRNALEPIKPTNCRLCGTEFLPASYNKALFCSIKCRKRFHKAKERDRARARNAATMDRYYQNHESNKEKCAHRAREQYRRDPVHARAKSKQLREKSIMKLQAGYLKKLIVASSGISHKSIPPAIVEAKREQIRLRRAIKQQKEQTK